MVSRRLRIASYCLRIAGRLKSEGHCQTPRDCAEVIPRYELPTTRNLGLVEILKTQGHPHRRSVLDERLQPNQCLIPLLGNEIEVLSHLPNRCGIEFK